MADLMQTEATDLWMEIGQAEKFLSKLDIVVVKEDNKQ